MGWGPQFILSNLRKGHIACPLFNMPMSLVELKKKAMSHITMMCVPAMLPVTFKRGSCHLVDLHSLVTFENQYPEISPSLS